MKPVEVYLAALQAGWYYVPINYRLSAPEIAYIIQDSGAKAIVSARALRRRDRRGRRRGRRCPAEARLAHGTVPGFRDVEAALAAQPDTLPEDRTAGAAMHYTSGTTGQAQGREARRCSGVDPDVMAELFTGFFSLFGIPHREDQVHLCTSPNYHTAVTTFAGNSLELRPPRRVHGQVGPGGDARQDRAATRVTHTHMVPTQFHRMLQLPDDVRAKYDVSSMRWAIHAAAPCPIDVKQKMLDWWGPVIWEYYGATEGGGTTATPEDWLKYPGTVGCAVADLRAEDHRRRPATRSPPACPAPSG